FSPAIARLLFRPFRFGRERGGAEKDDDGAVHGFSPMRRKKASRYSGGTSRLEPARPKSTGLKRRGASPELRTASRNVPLSSASNCWHPSPSARCFSSSTE